MADPAASLGLEGTAQEDEAAVKMQAVQRGKLARKQAEGKRIERELGLNGAEEEREAIVKMQAIERGRQDRAAAKERRRQEKELKRARKKFDQMDADGSGTLEGDELQQLAIWVFGSFHVGGEPISDERKQKEAEKLRKRLDEDGNGKLDFEEFTVWFKRTCDSITKYRRKQAAKAKKAKAQQAAAEATAAAAAEAKLAESRKGFSASGAPIRRWRRSPFPGAYYSGVPTQLHKRMPCKDGSTVDGLRIARRRGSMGATGELRDTWNSSTGDLSSALGVTSRFSTMSSATGSFSSTTFAGGNQGGGASPAKGRWEVQSIPPEGTEYNRLGS